MKGDCMKKTALQWKEYYTKKAFQEKYSYEGQLGSVCSGQESRFCLWSPCAEKVLIHFYKDGSKGEAFGSHPMQRKEKGVWEYCAQENLHGVYYDFSLWIEGEKVDTADPYARACGLNGRRSMAVDLRRTDPEGWEEDRPPARTAEDVIYEMHVKEFSWQKAGGFPEECRGKYTALCCSDTTLNGDGIRPTGLSYLKELGVTHIQLMPVFDYGSVDEEEKEASNWGYDPVNWNVPEGSYSSDPAHGEVRIRELKEAIQNLHKQGFRIVMDVVYNHTYTLDSWLQKTVPWYYYRTDGEGKPSNGSACGNDVASERPMCAAYILDSVLYWAEEYHMDGFRFDLMGLLDVDLMNRIRRALDEKYGQGEKLIYGEPWAAAPTAIEGGAVQALKKNLKLLAPGIGIFCDDTRDILKGSVFQLKETGFVNGKEGLERKVLRCAAAWCGKAAEDEGGEELRASAPSQILTYVSAHDNQTLWDKLSQTTPDENRRRAEYRLAAGIYMTCQGRLFFLSGEEFARTKGGLEDSYNAPISINRLDWEKAWEERELVEYYQGLIALRKRLLGLCDKSARAVERIRAAWMEEGFVGFYVDNRSEENPCMWKTLCIAYNRTDEERRLPIPEGDWEILADGKDSFLWKNPPKAGKCMQVAPVSILVLGSRMPDRV